MQIQQSSQPEIVARRPSRIVVWALVAWVAMLALIFLLLQSPADWSAWLDARWPKVVDVRSAVRSLFYRDYAN